MTKFFTLLLFVLFPPLSLAASFDCARAVTQMEKTICSDPELSKSDEDLAASYSRALKEASDPTAVKEQQREWLAAVQHCTDVSCFRDAYSARIARLTYPEDGLWTGTLGKQEVMACFENNSDPNFTNSAYYYLQNSQHIALVPRSGVANKWHENNLKNPTGIWTINDRYGDLLKGHWSDAAGNHVLPIRLTRFKTLSMGDTNSYSYNFTSSNFDCYPENNVFNATKNARIQKEKISSSKILTHDGRRYRILSLGGVSTLEIIDKTEASAALNSRLMNELKVGMVGYYDCPALTDGRDGTQAYTDYTASVELAFWNERWISFIQRTSGNCGGAYAFSNFDYTTWDLATGEKITLGAWLDQSERSRNRLNKIIAEQAIKQRLAIYPEEAKEENNCLDVIKENTAHQLGFGGKGLIFSSTFPRVVQACNYSVEIPYNELLPFLTKEGKDAAMSIIKPAPSPKANKGLEHGQ